MDLSRSLGLCHERTLRRMGSRDSGFSGALSGFWLRWVRLLLASVGLSRVLTRDVASDRTKQSTFSYLAARRVESWNGGVSTIVGDIKREDGKVGPQQKSEGKLRLADGGKT